MKGNPFTSQSFEHNWIKHYCKDQTITSFDFLRNVKFTKSKFWPIYVNLGKNFTNGITYDINNDAADFKGKVALIYDVQDFNTVEAPTKSRFKLNKVRQYEAYYGDLSERQTIEDVITANFNSSKSRYNFRRSLKQLNEAVDLKVDYFYGDIEKDTYLTYMQLFKDLLNKRFDDKSEYNTVLPMWDFYTDLIYDMIIEKRVVLNVLSNGEEPIAMSINFVTDNAISVAIRTFDITYNKLNIGNIEIYKLIEWCLENDIKMIDFSKGEGLYKTRWTEIEYHYDFHILYDSKSIYASIVGITLTKFFKFKQYLRDKQVNTWVIKLKYLKKRLLGQK